MHINSSKSYIESNNMKSILIALLLCLSANGKKSQTSPYNSLFKSSGYPLMGDIPLLNRKIFRGSRVSIREHPYIVSIRRNYVHYLVGSLLTKNLVVTIAHPLHGIPINELNVVVGENYSDRGTTLLTVVFLLFHKDFDPFTLKADILLLRIYEDLVIRSSSKTIALVSLNSVLAGTAFVTGWGRCDFTGKELCLPRSSIYFPDEWTDPMLRTISFEVNPKNSACNVYSQHNINIEKGMMCLGESRDKEPVAPCLGVPGAPLVLRGNLLGILSWGLGCGYAHDLPLIYTDIKYYSPWLVENVSLLRNITQRSIREIFLATKAVKLSDWLSKTRLNKPLSRPDLWINDLQSLEIDNDLSRLEGTVYDIRDFLNRGIHHSEKNNIYKDIQEKHNISEQHHNISYVIKTEPFLSNNSVYNLNTDNDGESDNDD